MATTKRRNYTVSEAAKDRLIELFSVAASSGSSTARARSARQRPELMVSAEGRVVPTDTSAHTQRKATGITHALIQLHRSYDLSDYFPKPSIPMYLTTPGTAQLFYNPPDLEYLALADQDPTDWQDLPNWEREDRLKEYRRKRGWNPADGELKSGNLGLTLPDDTRRYYHSLRVFHGIPLLPGCRRPESLTASVSTVLEAIGTDHLELPADYIYAISTPNRRLATALKIRLNNNGSMSTRKYGNHAGTAYIQKEWRALPSIDNFTQADVDYCLREDNLKSLGDLAAEAVQINPNLHIPEGSTLPTPVTDNQLSTTIRRAKPHIDHVPYYDTLVHIPSDKPGGRQYMYKTRDVTQVVNLAIEAHCGPDRMPLICLTNLADEWAIPIHALATLVTRELTRRKTIDIGKVLPDD